MSKKPLLYLISMMPEACLERAIKDCLYSLLVSGNLELAESIVSYLLDMINGHETLKAEAAVIGVKLAVKSRNMPLAVRRFEEIARIGNSNAIINLKADALLNLASGLLPDNPTRLMRLWEDCLTNGLPGYGQHALVQTGIMLVRQFIRNQDKHDAKAVCQSLRKYVDISPLDKKLLVFEKSLGI